MNIVLLEDLSIDSRLLSKYKNGFTEDGHTFHSYQRTDNINTLITETRDADVIIVANMPLPGEVIRSCKHLKFINIAFTGYDHVDISTAKKMGVQVSNASGYATESVAELALGMMISLLRNIPQAEMKCRNGETKSGITGRELSGKTVGIIGGGTIGIRIAELCKAFNCNILINTPHPKTNGVYSYTDLNTLLKLSDIVSLHCPLNESTRGLINTGNLNFMKKSSILINTARGSIVDTQALADKLNNFEIAGAGIDVFDTEPPLPKTYPLLSTPNTIITPHMAFYSEESMKKRAEIVFDTLGEWLRGNQINKVI